MQPISLLKLFLLYFYLFFQVVVFVLTLQCAFGIPDPGKAGKQCTLVRSPTDTGKDLWIRGLLLSIHVVFYGQFLGQISLVSNKSLFSNFVFTLPTNFYVLNKKAHPAWLKINHIKTWAIISCLFIPSYTFIRYVFESRQFRI